MEALSDSTVIRLCSALMVSPGWTSTSMMATSAKSPMSGTLMSMIAMGFRPSEIKEECGGNPQAARRSYTLKRAALAPSITRWSQLRLSAAA